MLKPSSRMLPVVFFCSVGLVYSGSAIGDDSVEGVESAPTAPVSTPTPVPPADATNSLFAPEGGVEKLPDGQTVAVSSFGQIDLHVKDLDLTQVLQLLSIQSQRNIVATRNVAGTISADLYGVDFFEALDAILQPNGFGYVEKGNFIYIYTAAELKAMQEAERKLAHRVSRLNYISAGDASKFVAPLLSPAGSISVSADASAGFAPSTSDGGANSFAAADTLVIRDYQENVDQILGVLKELDVRPRQVLVEASILQARLSERNAFGVDLTILGDFAVDQFTSPLGAIDEIISGAVKQPAGQGAAGGAQTTVGNTAGGQSGVKVGVVSNSVAAFITALDSVTDTTILANPKILVLNRQRADLLVGERLGYLSSTATDTSTTQTVEFLDVGTQLTVRPFVSEDNFIRMELRPSISSGETRTVTSPNGVSVIPDQTTQEMTTNVIVRSGQTIVLGGLFKEDTIVSRRQVPLLGDVPILGTAFKGQDDTVTRNEVIFLITPTIVKDEALYATGDSVKDTMHMTRLGAREALLPFSRSKLTATHMRKALQYHAAGNREKALWSVNMALSLDPTTIEALRLREELTGERTYWPDSGIMNDAVNTFIKDRLDEVTPMTSDAGDAAAAESSTETADAAADEADATAVNATAAVATENAAE